MAKLNATSRETAEAYKKEIRRIKQFIRRGEKRGYSFDTSVIPKKPDRITKRDVKKLKQITPNVLYQKATYAVTSPYSDEVTVVSGYQGRTIERKRAAKLGQYTRKINKYTKAKDEIEAERKRDKFYQDKDKMGVTYTEPTKREVTQEDIDKGWYEPAPIDIEKLPKEADVVLNNTVEELKKVEDISLEAVQREINDWTPDAGWTKNLTDAKQHDKDVLAKILAGAIASSGKEAVAKRIQDNIAIVMPLISEILYASGSKEGNFKDGRTQVNFDLVTFSTIVMGRALTPEESSDLTDLVETLGNEE